MVCMLRSGIVPQVGGDKNRSAAAHLSSVALAKDGSRPIYRKSTICNLPRLDRITATDIITKDFIVATEEKEKSGSYGNVDLKQMQEGVENIFVKEYDD